jgi:hypothetical protein
MILGYITSKIVERLKFISGTVNAERHTYFGRMPETYH